tara:strand:- start:1178 stop:1381 length:204 start_codon:yes stop_codon:yes gene_type:complete
MLTKKNKRSTIVIHPFEVEAMIKKETDPRDKHIEILKQQLKEEKEMNRRLLTDLGRPPTTKWVDNNE